MKKTLVDVSPEIKVPGKKRAVGTPGISTAKASLAAASPAALAAIAVHRGIRALRSKH